MRRLLLNALLATTLMSQFHMAAGESRLQGRALVDKMSALASNPALVLFKAAVFDPAAGVPGDDAFALSPLRERGGVEPAYVVQFDAAPGDSERAEIGREGGKIVGYIPNNAYLVQVPEGNISRLSSKEGLRAVFRLPKFAKIDPELTAGLSSDQAVQLVAPEGGDLTAAADILAGRFPSMRFTTSAGHHRQGRIVCEVPATLLHEFLDFSSGLEEILYILPWSAPQLLNDNSIWVIQSYDTVNTTNYALSATVWNHGITGTGQIACVMDTGATPTMCQLRYDGTAGSVVAAQTLTAPDTGTVDLTKKVVAYYVEPGAAAYDEAAKGYHGSHVSGILAGDNYATLSTPTSGGHDSGDGMAPNAQLVIQDIGSPSGNLALLGDLQLQFLQAYNAGARLHSNSWGTQNSLYDPFTVNMDQFTYRHEDFLFITAMGNSGAGLGDGSIGSPATGKNVVSVGATSGGSDYSADYLMWFSSRGPTDDGRLKPDVCAPGANINSAEGGTDCATANSVGTSMAAPCAAGGLALVRQYFADGWYPSGTKTAADARTPSAALLKACLVGGAMEMAGQDTLSSNAVTRIPSLDQGWGRVYLEDALYFSGDGRRTRLWDVWNDSGLATGEVAEHPLAVVPGAQPLKVHLVWTDPESNPMVAVNLVNNLDLEVVSPSGVRYKGNVFTWGQSTAIGDADVLNNVEGVVFPSPETGTWTLRVVARSVPGASGERGSARQGYALVAIGAACASSLGTPTGLTATAGSSGIGLSWGALTGATGYEVYRAMGSGPSAASYSLIAQVSGTAFTDAKVQGGNTYWYKVRATDDCSESPPSSAASASYSGTCSLPPTFAGLSGISNTLGTSDCDLVLTWSAATGGCPSAPTVRYNIYRGATPYFTPDAASRIATGLSGTTYTDYAVSSMKTYYYLVRAEDSTTRLSYVRNVRNGTDSIRNRNI